jgi:hypothetical protein
MKYIRYITAFIFHFLIIFIISNGFNIHNIETDDYLLTLFYAVVILLEILILNNVDTLTIIKKSKSNTKYVYKIFISIFIILLILILFKEKSLTQWIYNEKYKLWWLLIYPVSYLIYYTIKLLDRITVRAK